jgi:hypothetical protein
MITLFVGSIRSEWLKRKRSLAAWLVVIGALFAPSIQALIQILRPAKTPERFAAPDFWIHYFNDSWQAMVSLLLPMGITLAVSLVAQLEYKNNTWKQLHATPQPYPVIFFSKLVILLAMELQLFLLFNLAVILSAGVTAAALPAVTLPQGPIPILYFLRESSIYFMYTLPIVALQYLLSLVFRNFLVAVGAGMVLLVTNLVALSWEYVYFFPYSYPMLHFLKRFPEINLTLWALGWAGFLLAMAYVFYVRKPDKG